jgi:hypothetical protein
MRIKDIAEWKLKKDGENFLMSLLMNDMDKVACDSSTTYLGDANMDLFKFACSNENIEFMKYALSQNVFSATMLQKESVIIFLLETLQNGF